MFDELINQIKDLAGNYKQILASKVAELKTTAAPSKNIAAAVGKGGQNTPADVITVQELLNKNGAKLTADGDCGKLTIAAILAFQVKKFGTGDGRVDVNGATWKALIGNETTPQTNTNTNTIPTKPTDNQTHTEDTNTTTPAKPLPGKLKGKSVGKGGDNVPEDVIVVQKLLNKKLRLSLPENGDCDSATIKAIEQFQMECFGTADGRIDVAGGMTMGAGNVTWKALRGSGRADLGAPADVKVKTSPNGKTPQGLPDQIVICAPDGDATSLPVLVLVGGMHGYGGQFMVDCVPAGIFKKAVVMGLGYNANLATIAKAYLDYFGKPFNKGNAAICGFSAGGNVQGYMAGFRKVGLIDPVVHESWAGQFSSNTILSYNNTGWPRTAMSEVKRIGESKGATVEETTVSHGAYPEYFLGKFGSKLV